MRGGFAYILFVLCLALVAMAGPANDAGAQSFGDYGGLQKALSGSGDDDEAGSEAAQSLPQSSAPAAAASFDAYGQAADSYVADSSVVRLQRGVDGFRKQFSLILSRIPDAPAEIMLVLQQSSPDFSKTYFLGVALFMAFLLTIGRAAAALYYVYVARRIFVGVQRANPQGLVEKLPVLAYRILLTFVGLAITVLISSSIAVGFTVEHEATQILGLMIIGAYSAIFMINNFWRMVAAPYLPDYRIPVMNDVDARRLYLWASTGTTIGIVMFTLTAWLQELGLPNDIHALIASLSGLLMVLYVIALVRANGHAIGHAILGGQERQQASWLAAVLSALWAPAAILYFGLAWGEMTFRLVIGIPAGANLFAGAFLVMLAGLVVYAAFSYVIARIFTRLRERNRMNEAAKRADEVEDGVIELSADRTQDMGDADDEGGPGVEAADPPPVYTPPRRTMRTFEDLAQRIATLFALGAAMYALIMIWGGPDLLAEGSVLDRVQDITDILLIGYIIYHAIRIWMDQKIEEEGGDDIELEPGDEGGGASAASRLGTLLPLVRNFILLTIIISVALMLATRFGVSVAPLFAGAGVVGLAIGFGSQTLVRDILSGAFYLMDDAFRKGEYIDIGEVKGTVEKISLRSFQLRHHLGALHTIPFGEITHLTNYSRDWVMMKLPLRVTYDTDVEKVRKMVKKLGQRLLEDPDIGQDFLQPLKSQGVYMMEDSAMIIRIKFMTRPGKQWVVRKRVYADIRELFEREGVKFAHREVTVRLADSKQDKELSDDEMEAVGAAARRAIDDADQASSSRPRAIGDDR